MPDGELGRLFLGNSKAPGVAADGSIELMVTDGVGKLVYSTTLCWRPKLTNTMADRYDRLGRLVKPVWAYNLSLVRVFCLESFCNPIWNGYVLPAYKYKGCGRLRVF